MSTAKEPSARAGCRRGAGLARSRRRQLWFCWRNY